MSPSTLVFLVLIVSISCVYYVQFNIVILSGNNVQTLVDTNNGTKQFETTVSVKEKPVKEKQTEEVNSGLEDKTKDIAEDTATDTQYAMNIAEHNKHIVYDDNLEKNIHKTSRDADTFTRPMIRKEAEEGGNDKIRVFYNVFTNETSAISHVQSIVNEQMHFLRSNHEVHYNSIGVPFSIENATLIKHHANGSEEVTLKSLWEYCQKNLNDKVVYLHSKGSFHDHRNNKKLRPFVTRGALSEGCSKLPNVCNVCSSRFSPIPHPHTPGNMWLARCEYVAKLIDPYEISSKMEAIIPGGGACEGVGRYALEHWIYSHPNVVPCDLHIDPRYTWKGKPLPFHDYMKVLKLAPRFDLKTYIKPEKQGCGKVGQSLEGRIDEYKKLYDLSPPASWWGWNLYTNSLKLQGS